MGAIGTEEEEGYIGWRNLFLGIDYLAAYTFKNTGSGIGLPMVNVLESTLEWI